MEKRMSIRTFRDRYRNGDFRSQNREDQIEAGWYDWFCHESELAERLATLWNVLEGVDSENILDNYSVQFKNNSTLEGALYDSITFIPLEDNSNKLRFCVAIDDKRRKGKYTILIFRNQNNCKDEMFFDDVIDVLKFITAENHSKDEMSFDDIVDVWKFINDWK